MTLTASVRRRALGATAITAVALALAFAGALVTGVGPASAHNQVIGTVPSADQTLTELPAEFSITTNEALLDLDGGGRGFALDIVGPDELHYGSGCVTIVDATMSQPVASLGPAGDYTVTWQIVSADGHTVSGDFAFTWAPADAAASTAPEEPSCARAEGTEPGSSADTDDGDSGSASESFPLGDLLWIGGAVLAVGVAAVVTIVVLSRKRTEPPQRAEPPQR